MAELASAARRAACLASVAAIAFLGVGGRAVLAHEVDVFAHAEGRTIHGQVHFGDDIPAKDAIVTIRDPAGKTLGAVRTDQHGQFVFEAKTRCDHRLMVDVGGGHGAEYVVKAAELPDGLPSSASTIQGAHANDSVDLAAIHHQIIELRRQLHQYERTTRFRDVLGGIGYILGIAGVAIYLHGTRRISAQTAPPKRLSERSDAS